MRRILTWAFLSQLVFSPSAAIANWPSQPGVNLAIAVGPESQAPGAIVSDLAGGAIISWTSSPYFGGQGILAQRTDRLGRLLWASAGVPLSAAVGRASYPAAVSDGAGGAIVGWIVMPPQIVPTTIRLQRIGADGQVLWGVDGIEIPASDNVDFASLVMVPDGAGGAILAWEGARAGIRNPVILSQRVDAAGSLLWDPAAVALATGDVYREDPVIVADGAGGAVVVWDQIPDLNGTDLAAQRVDSEGHPLWGELGVLVCDAPGDRGLEAVGSDGNGGFVVCWNDERGSLYAQRLNGSGAASWAANGMPAANGTGTVRDIVADGTGGVYFDWMGFRGVVDEVFVQRLATDGTRRWGANGTPVGAESLGRIASRMITDASGGVIVCWSEAVGGLPITPQHPQRDCRAQRLDADGNWLWGDDGAAVSTAPSAQEFPRLVEDGEGGAIATWNDWRSGTNLDVYAQHINRLGKLGPGSPPAKTASREILAPGASRLELASPFPNPTRGGAMVGFRLALASRVTLTVRDVAGKQIRVLYQGEASSGPHQVPFDAKDERGVRMASGLYFVTIHDGRQSVTRRLIVL